MSKLLFFAKWINASSLLLVSVAIFDGLSITLQSYFFEILFIKSSSVLTHVSLTLLLLEALITYQIRGYPQTLIIFFFGISLLPPLAVINETILIFIL